ncbi:MAG: hypothetical protein GVY28_05830, partial [Alphaproteobacteria bacterium]|nr:hypothetical protein [Alphaproteobacteria bacterium]
MTLADIDSSWVDDLTRDGPAALEVLLAGAAPLGRLAAAEAEDAVAALLHGQDADDPAMRAFDAACLDRLEAARDTLPGSEGP